MRNFDASALQEIPISKEAMQQILSNTPSDAVLVGGQALVFWVEHFNIDVIADKQNTPFISRDVDFLGSREHVKAFADAISGVADYPSEQAITILCGQIFLVKKDKNSYMNIDVIHRIGNMDSDAVRRRSVEGIVQGNSFQVMHPLDVLTSRVENYRGIREKQNEIGLRQVELAIEVAKMYVIETAHRDEKIALKAIEAISAIARSAAGINARKYGAEIYDAIDPAHLAQIIKNENFLSVRLPLLDEEIRQAKTLPQAKAQGIYLGTILTNDGENITQDMGRNKLVEHKLAHLDMAPAIGDMVTIAYDAEGCGVVQIPTIDKSRGNER